MMCKPNIAFVHDNRFFESEGEIYSDPQFSENIWNRYLDFSGSVTVFGRKLDCFSPGLVKSSCENVSFLLIESLSSFGGLLKKNDIASKYFKEVFEKVDGVVVRLPSELGLAAIDFAHALNKPIFVELVGCAFDAYWNHGALLAKLYSPLAYIRTRKAVLKASHVLYVTEEFLQRRYPSAKSADAIACSDVVLEHMVSNSDINYCQKGDRFVFGLVGSLKTKYKGIQTVIKALSTNKNLKKKVVFRVLGGGDQGPWKKLVERHGLEGFVFFDGTLSNKSEVMAWLDSLDCYLQPSLTEGLPRALVEAMSRGLPAIASNVGGIPELLSRDSLITPGDFATLGQRMVVAISSLSWRVSQGALNFKRSAQFSVGLIEARRREFYRSFSTRISR